MLRILTFVSAQLRLMDRPVAVVSVALAPKGIEVMSASLNKGERAVGASSGQNYRTSLWQLRIDIHTTDGGGSSTAVATAV